VSSERCYGKPHLSPEFSPCPIERARNFHCLNFRECRAGIAPALIVRLHQTPKCNGANFWTAARVRDSSQPHFWRQSQLLVTGPQLQLGPQSQVGPHLHSVFLGSVFICISIVGFS
jgi:hypothetical protein